VGKKSTALGLFEFWGLENHQENQYVMRVERIDLLTNGRTSLHPKGHGGKRLQGGDSALGCLEQKRQRKMDMSL